MTAAALLSNPVTLWESISIDGVQYPFDDSRYNKTPDERAIIQNKINQHDNEKAAQIAALIEAEDDAGLGKLIREQAIGYAIALQRAAQ